MSTHTPKQSLDKALDRIASKRSGIRSVGSRFGIRFP